MKNLIYIAIGFAIAIFLFSDKGKKVAKKLKNEVEKEEFTLKKGDSGPRVKKLQTALNFHSPEPDMMVQLSGDFDQKTEDLAFVVTGSKKVTSKVYRNLLEALQTQSFKLFRT